MNEMSPKLKARSDRKNAKRGLKKQQIAESAIKALIELGYANTSLRDIAEKSDMSLGMLHYYFEDRADLIVFCVSRYKQGFVAEIARALEAAKGRESVVNAFSDVLSASIVNNAQTHRLWYDIRNQAMFDEAFRPEVEDIERKLIGVVRSAFQQAGQANPADVECAYALLDGAFRFLMQGQFGSSPKSQEDVKAVFQNVLNRFL
ncbi:Transcriptional regulator, TetR family [Sulfitobacter noctilucae]|uniref:TetR/AcrR family transcriptional regulator n=1 Tax=Sulfitobacter noctilucae TaxID=1342302 RepID=UPI00046AD1A4|nr:TetR/AcrR family transcriptional regulator [Sulfitobacter noctilucae]KIN60335.1 Transcriptional regulator, TetR family [Sulfitobacter noctilucae]